MSGVGRERKARTMNKNVQKAGTRNKNMKRKKKARTRRMQ